MKKYRKIHILGLFAIVFLSGFVIASDIITRRITTSGTIYIKTLGLEAYWDINCTNVASNLDWGTLEPGDVQLITIYLKNSGNSAMILSLVAENFVPFISSNYLNVTWNREVSGLAIGQVLQADITLNVSKSITGINNFSFDIVLSGEG